MFVLQVACNCGFQSAPAIWGPEGTFDQDRVGIPVYLPSSGNLLTRWFSGKDLKISPEELEAWISTRGRQAITAQYGDEAVLVTPPGTANETILRCPKCRRVDARVEVVGIH